MSKNDEQKFDFSELDENISGALLDDVTLDRIANIKVRLNELSSANKTLIVTNQIADAINDTTNNNLDVVLSDIEKAIKVPLDLDSARYQGFVGYIHLVRDLADKTNQNPNPTDPIDVRINGQIQSMSVSQIGKTLDYQDLNQPVKKWRTGRPTEQIQNLFNAIKPEQLPDTVRQKISSDMEMSSLQGDAKGLSRPYENLAAAICSELYTVNNDQVSIKAELMTAMGMQSQQSSLSQSDVAQLGDGLFKSAMLTQVGPERIKVNQQTQVLSAELDQKMKAQMSQSDMMSKLQSQPIPKDQKKQIKHREKMLKTMGDHVKTLNQQIQDITTKLQELPARVDKLTSKAVQVVSSRFQSLASSAEDMKATIAKSTRPTLRRGQAFDDLKSKVDQIRTQQHDDKSPKRSSQSTPKPGNG